MIDYMYTQKINIYVLGGGGKYTNIHILGVLHI